MTLCVRTMPIAEAGAGMVLAEAVRDQGGGVLLAAGATLTGATLNALRRRGIDSLGIMVTDGDNGEADAPGAHERASEAERVRQCARLARLFRHSAALGATGALLEHLMSYRKNH